MKKERHPTGGPQMYKRKYCAVAAVLAGTAIAAACSASAAPVLTNTVAVKQALPGDVQDVRWGGGWRGGGWRGGGVGWRGGFGGGRGGGGGGRWGGSGRCALGGDGGGATGGQWAWTGGGRARA